MPENEFEKKVSSEMQELTFKPSETVWLRVEERIRRKKKRRVFVIVFLLAGLALLGYWQWENFFGGKKNEIVNAAPVNTAVEKQNENNSTTSNEINNNSTNKQNTETTKKEETKNTNEQNVKTEVIENKSTVADRKGNSTTKNIIVKPGDSKKNETKVKPAPAKRKNTLEPEVSIDIVSANSQRKDPVADDKKVIDPAVKTNIQVSTADDKVMLPQVKQKDDPDIQKKSVADSVTNKVIQKKDEQPEKKDTVLKAEPVLPAPIVKKDTSQKKWKWGLHLSPGISSLNNHSISLLGLKSATAFDYQSPSAGSGAGAAPMQRPSDVKAGFAFQAGVFTQRQLSNRTSFSIGLQYGYYSNIIRIGNRRDSLLNVLDFGGGSIYSAGGDTLKFTNSYHFIELPLRFQWQLNKSKTNPFTWSAGFTVGQLIASNALMYDTAYNGIYYKNNKLINKTQFSLSTGFSWTIANGKRAEWRLGPAVNVHLNKLVDNPFENKKYLFFAGVRTSVLFNKKK